LVSLRITHGAAVEIGGRWPAHGAAAGAGRADISVGHPDGIAQ